MIPTQREASPIEIGSQGRGWPDEAAKGNTPVDAKGARPVVVEPSAHASANGEGGAVLDRKRIAEIRIDQVVHAVPPVEADGDVEACTGVVRAACEMSARLEGGGVSGERDAKAHRSTVPVLRVGGCVRQDNRSDDDQEWARKCRQRSKWGAGFSPDFD